MIAYCVRLADLNQHLIEVECRIPDPAETQHLSLPSWIPGSYLLREFARHVVGIEATSPSRSVHLEKIDHSTWVATGAAAELRIVLRVHALDLSVRGAYLDGRRGYFNGTCVFARIHGRERETVDVVLEPPVDARSAGWRVGTALSPVEIDTRGFGRYAAGHYEELIDHPVEISDFARVDFVAGGVAHELIIAGRHRTDLDRIAADLRQLCEAHLRFFGPPAPFDHYVFLGLAVEKGYGGLEHRASSSLVFDADDLPRPGETGVPRDYQRFLGLLSHEYFHAWHVKRLKPAVFVPYRLNERNHTRLLWVFEGITTYYQDLMLLRSDLIGRDAYLNRLAQTLTRVYRTPGRLRQSLAEASFDAWDKLYKPESNSVNATISYYTKGALVALALDLTLRRQTDGAVSLDAVLLDLWNRYRRTGEGIGEDDFERACAELAGESLQAFFDAAVRGTADLPLAELLDAFGVTLELRAATGPQDGGGVPVRRDAEPRLSLGATYKDGAAGLELASVLADGPAERGGLNAGDHVIALDGYGIDAASLARRLARYEAGERVSIAFFRRNELLETEVTLASAPLDTCALVAHEAPRPEPLALRRAWLGS
jgi:predicted metalloprotease with PDZ domain